MMIIDKLKYMLMAAYKAGQIYDISTSNRFLSNRLLGEIVRNTHSIEKGLSLENVRLGFGYIKIKSAISFIKKYEQLNSDIYNEKIQMFMDALAAYLEFHNAKEFSDDHIEEIRREYNELMSNYDYKQEQYGGIKIINRPSYNKNEVAFFERVVSERHSVREFDGSPVPEDLIKKAINLAMLCPSACNRQCYRVNIIHKNNFCRLEGWMDGIGGFADDLDKMLLITSRISDYRPSEHLQYIVSPAVFAGYLTLSLQVYGIGCCFIQRPVLPNKKYNEIANFFSIPEDELAICILGIGNLKPEYKVPVSHRLNYNEIVRNN